MKKHGLCGTKLYNVWLTMRQRCYNPNDKHYKWYGAKGVKVCDEWKDPKVFYTWCITNEYKDGLTIDRIDHDGDYTPENCRFITMSDQQRNKSSCKNITFKGETRTVQEWAEQLQITPSTLRSRFNKGWDLVRALTEPIRGKHSL